MKKVELTQADKMRLKQNIKISIILGFLFFLVLIIIIGIVPGVLFLFGKRPADGFVTRGLIILGLISIPFLVLSWNNILKFLDIKRGKKLEFVSSDYEIIKNKSSVSLRLKDNANRDIEVWDELLPLIDITQPLKIDIAILSKEIIFISHNNKNLLDD
jgi:hypothetical protein